MLHSLRRIAALLTLTVGLAAAPALAQTSPTAPDPGAARTAPADTLKVEDLEGLIETLENEAERKQFVKTLKDLVAARKATEQQPSAVDSFVNAIIQRIRRTGARLAEFATFVSDLPKLGVWFDQRFSTEAQRARLMEGAWKAGLVLLVGLVAGLLVGWLLRRPRRSVEDRRTESVLVRVGYLAIRTLLDLLPLVAFAIAAYVSLPLLDPSPTASAVALAVILAAIISRAVTIGLRALLAPRLGSLRVLPFGDETAAYLYVWGRRLANVIVFGFFGLVVLNSFGLPAAVYDALLQLLGLIVAIMLVVWILQNRRNVAGWLSGDRAKRGRTLGKLGRRLGDVWHIFAILYVAAAFMVWALEVEGGFLFLVRATLLTVVIAALTRLLLFGVRKALDRAFRIDPDLVARNPRLEERANRYLPIVRSVMFGVVYLIAGLAILQVWGLDILAVLSSPAGRSFAGSAVTIVVVIVAAVIIWELINSAIDRYMLRLSDNSRNSKRAVRLRTLLPMLDKLILVTIIVAVTLIVLAEIGVNIGPLLAGAGVIGLAIGFGAQTLVKDVITGIFIIIEDAMAVGDIVTVAGHTGTVEDLSMRSVVMRDFHGTQYTIPFSSVSEVQNLTKDFAYSIMDFGVSYRENVDEVMAVIAEVGAAMRTDENFGLNILDDLEIWGLNEFGDSAVVIRTRFKCAPGTQWGIRREMNRRIKAAFDARGIEIPFPHVTLYFGEDKEGAAPPAHLRLDSEPGPGRDRTSGAAPALPTPEEPPPASSQADDNPSED